MAEPQLDVRHVILPWARPETSPAEGHGRAARKRVESDARALRVHRDRLAIHEPGDGTSEAGAGLRPGLGLPPLHAHGLPFKPHPSIPEEDRVPLEPNALLAAAVALDILASATRAIEASPAVLSELTATLLSVGRIGGIDAAAIERLLGHAESRVGNTRASLSRLLAVCMATSRRADGEPTAPGAAHASTPRAAGQALRRIEAAAEVAIHESRLRLDAQEVVEYKRA